MNTDQIPVFSNMLAGIIFLAISIRLMKRKIKMNDLYGFRTSKAFKSGENWYNINAYFGKQLSVWSTLVFLVGIVCIFVPTNKDLNQIIGAEPIAPSFTFSTVTTLLYEHGL